MPPPRRDDPFSHAEGLTPDRQATVSTVRRHPRAHEQRLLRGSAARAIAAGDQPSSCEGCDEVAYREPDTRAHSTDDHYLQTSTTERKPGHAALRRPDGKERQQRARKAHDQCTIQ